jgi:hypothetical protein
MHTLQLLGGAHMHTMPLFGVAVGVPQLVLLLTVILTALAVAGLRLLPSRS